MSSNGKYSSLIWGMCVVILACDGLSRGPVAPGDGPPAASSVPAFETLPFDGAVDESIALADGSALLATGGRAGGHADLHGTPVQNVRDQTYSFTAVSAGAPPLAKGQVEVHLLRFTGEELTVHAQVTCVSVVADQAWVGSQVTRLVVDGQDVPEFVGRPMIFRVRDLGEGNGATDLASLVFFGVPAGGDLAHCNARPDFPILRESTSGNIQVKPPA